MTERRIEAKRRGNALGFWFFRVALKFTGLRGAYGLLYIVCAWYALFDGDAVRSASAYLRRRFPGTGAVRNRIAAYRLFVSQGKQLIDRAAVLSRAVDFSFTLVGREQLDELAKFDGGVVLLTAHVGNWQIALDTLRCLNRKVCLVMRPEDNPAVRDALKIDGRSDQVEIISPEGHLGGVVPVMNALREGNVVSFMGDRAYGFESVDVDFLGSTARFPCGAFVVAAAARVPVIVMLTAKTGVASYTVDVSNVMRPEYRPGHGKREQLAGWVQEFARMLDRYVDEHPYQCFLFHDVWTDKKGVAHG